MTREELKEFLPHRDPMLLVDEIEIKVSFMDVIAKPVRAVAISWWFCAQI